MPEFEKDNTALADAMESHLIDDLSEFGVWTDDYETFLQKRAEVVSAELKKRIIPRATDTLTLAARADDFEEEMTAFQ